MTSKLVRMYPATKSVKVEARRYLLENMITIHDRPRRAPARGLWVVTQKFNLRRTYLGTVSGHFFIWSMPIWMLFRHGLGIRYAAYVRFLKELGWVVF